MGLGTFRRRDYQAPELLFFWIHFSVAMLFRFVARFARGMIEDPSFNRFTLKGIPEIACHIVFRHNSKNKNRKILVFLSIQPIPDLSCKFAFKTDVYGP